MHAVQRAQRVDLTFERECVQSEGKIRGGEAGSLVTLTRNAKPAKFEFVYFTLRRTGSSRIRSGNKHKPSFDGYY